MKSPFAFILILLLALPGGAKTSPSEKSLKDAATSIELVTWPIPLMTEGPNKGLFFELVSEIQRRSKKKIKVTLQNRGQALVDFSNGKYHGVFPAHALSTTKGAYKSSPFYLRKDFIFYQKSKQLTKIQDLEGKKVGLTFRYTYDPQILNNRKIRFEYGDDDFSNMKKLGEGKIDAFIVEEKSGRRALQQSGYSNITYDSKQPLGSLAVYFAFEESAQGERYQRLFNKYLEDMKKDGFLDRLFSLDSVN